MVGSGLRGTSVWNAPVTWRARYDIWRQGGRRVTPGWADYEDITPSLAEHGAEILPYRIDVDAFWRYVDDTGYRQSRGGLLPVVRRGILPSLKAEAP